jgi:hypothetical protein
MKKGAQPSSRKNENALFKALGILKAWKIKKQLLAGGILFNQTISNRILFWLG